MTTHMLQKIGGPGDSVARQLGHNAERLAELAPRLMTLLEPVVMVRRFYRLAEALEFRLGRDPDRPRNMRKVTEAV